MAETYRSGTDVRSPQAQGAPTAEYPTYDVGSRASGRADDQGRYESSRSANRVDDLVPVLGMLIGGGIGYMLATMIPSAQSTAGQRRGRGMWSRSVEKDETTDLIASNKVEGTAVYNREGERLGEVYNFMVGKRSGKVAYAVMSFGGFLGIGQRYHALPWDVLTYDTNRGGYVINASKDRLMNAPTFAQGEDPFAQPDHMRRIREYWTSGRLSL